MKGILCLYVISTYHQAVIQKRCIIFNISVFPGKSELINCKIFPECIMNVLAELPGHIGTLLTIIFLLSENISED